MGRVLIGGTLAGSLAVGILAFTHFHASNADPRALDNVPWTNAPGQPFEAVAGSAFPACLPASLVPVLEEAVWGGAWHGSVSGSFALRNASPVTCSLAVPSVTAIGGGTTAAFNTDGVPQEPVVIGPNGTVTLQVLIDDTTCSNTTINSTALTLQFPQGPVAVPGATLPIQCKRGRLVDFHSNTVGAADVKGPASSLEATIKGLPPSVAPGATLNYAVTLHNPTDSDISLASDCPSYEQTLKGVDASSSVYQLNCSQGAVVPAGGTLSFAMQLPVPSSAPSGTTFVTWKLQVPMLDSNANQFASAQMTIS